MNLDGRNALAGIADRVHMNLAFIPFARNLGAELHEVTQLLLSLFWLDRLP